MKDLLTALVLPGKPSVHISGLHGGSNALAVARIMARTGRPVLVITPSEEQAEAFEQDLALFTSALSHLFPGYDIPPYTPLSPDPRTVADRLATLYQLTSSSQPFAVTVPAEALLRRLLPAKTIDRLADLVISGDSTNPDHLMQRLTDCGYETVSLVQSVGECSRRGGIIDIYPTGFDFPVRLDFFGDTVESIRQFDPISQRRISDLHEIIILPVSDIILPPIDSTDMQKISGRFLEHGRQLGWHPATTRQYAATVESGRKFPGIEFFLPLCEETPVSLFDYLPPGTMLFLTDEHNINAGLTLAFERITTNHAEAVRTATPALSPAALFLSPDEVRQKISSYSAIIHDPLGAVAVTEGNPPLAIATGNHTLLRQQMDLSRKQQGFLAVLAKSIHDWTEHGDRVLLACRSVKQAKQMTELLANHQLAPLYQQAPLDPADLPAGRFTVTNLPLSRGFDLTDEHARVLSDLELFGNKRLGGKQKKSAERRGDAITFDELKTGDIVVHREHGLAIYDGIVNFAHDGAASDYLQLTYQGNDKLYVPVDRIHAVSKYKGIEGTDPKLDKLGGKSWATTTNKVKEAVWKVAVELLDLYARRQLVPGHAFSRPDSLYQELEETFPYDETAGQLAAINDVINDLTSERPMERLVCGDVGYGKTEVAVRAAFKVIGDSQQVAVLVPTTVLAEQHAATFRERLGGFPVRIECLNRFRSTVEQRHIIAGLADGTVDLVIGTHRLLSKDVVFKRLGLLVIDEEHRFGVKHKERLKKLKNQVDVLTLTATPIPRTLQLSLLGIRDLSVISTPPAQRRTVKTFIAKYDELVIKEAVNRELLRNGQVFLVHNRVQSINEVAFRVSELAPQARVAVAHGQMAGKVLEDIMVRFVRREIDVLVCTTIIESGLDIPNANTIIITRADRLGLAEIYQLRGRVGRGREQAYCYLLMPSLENLSKDAQHRLRALMDYNELGGGFKLAMSDLQIRGGGNILGESQSGTIAAVGYDLYLDLLQKTVDDIKRRAEQGEDLTADETVDIDPEVSLKFAAFIPDHYIADTDQRYFAYRRIATITSEEALLDLEDELTDRYGRPPQETRHLFAVMRLKMDLKKIFVEKLEQGPANLVFHFHAKTPVTPEQLISFVSRKHNNARLTPEGKLVITVGQMNGQQALDKARTLISSFSPPATD